jgi:hypothetical protein
MAKLSLVAEPEILFVVWRFGHTHLSAIAPRSFIFASFRQISEGYKVQALMVSHPDG